MNITFENATKYDIDTLNDIAKKKYSNLVFKRNPSIFIFTYPKEKNFSLLRDFKTFTDIAGISSFNINSSVLTLTVNDKYEYEDQLKRIQNTADFAIVEKKAYEKKWKINFLSDSEESRELILNKIQNELRQRLPDGIVFQTFKKNSSLMFSKKL